LVVGRDSPEDEGIELPEDDHFEQVVDAIVEGELVPFLGAGASLCDRPKDASWTPGQTQYFPSAKELASHLAERFSYPGSEEEPELVRVSQYAALERGTRHLYKRLREVFDADYQPTTLHAFLARLPALLRARGAAQQLIVTTNYDDALERAFRAAGEPFDLVSYVAEGLPDERGRFVHWPPEGEPVLIKVPNTYRALSLEERATILKIHGAVDRSDPERDSYVITEDHYIEYLSRTELSNLIPVHLLKELRSANFLFLGYSMRDWNLRVILHRIAAEQRLGSNSWAIQLHPSRLDQKFWARRNVEILDVSLEKYVAELQRRLEAGG
jgi:SIR2-like domain